MKDLAEIDAQEWFVPLSYNDIEEKIRINQEERGYDLITLKELLEHELFLIERHFLKCMFNKEPFAFSSRVQIQNLKEQISYINNKILRELQCQHSTLQAQ